MRIELTHDIIALKIWEQLPEQDKQLRMVKNSLHQRLRDYNRGSGSLLGEKELIAWEEYLTLLKLSVEQKDFIEKSRMAVEQKKAEKKANEQRKLQLTQQKLAVEKRARKRQVYFSIGLGLLATIAIGLSIWALRSQKQATKKEEEALASAKNMALALQDFVEIKGKETFDAIGKAENVYDFETIVLTAKEFKVVLDNSENQIQNGINREVAILNFATAIDSLKNKVTTYITNYESIVNSGKAERYKHFMLLADQAISSNDYDGALSLNIKARDLKINSFEQKVKDKETEIRKKAFDFYLSKAQIGFKESDRMVLSKKFINPFINIQKAESFIPEGSSASLKLKKDICSHPSFQKNTKHPDILKIKKACK